jgi:hypothetical protein
MVRGTFWDLIGKKPLEPKKPYTDLVVKDGKLKLVKKGGASDASASPGAPGKPGAPVVGDGASGFHKDSKVEAAIRNLRIPSVNGSARELGNQHRASVMHLNGKVLDNSKDRQQLVTILAHVFQHGVGLDEEAAAKSAQLTIPYSSTAMRNPLRELLLSDEVKTTLLPEVTNMGAQDEAFQNVLGLFYFKPSMIRPIYHKLLADPGDGELLSKVRDESMKRQGKL